MKKEDFEHKTHVVSSHEEVLLPWAEYRLACPEMPPPTVLVLDHHTDILPAFRNEHAVIEKDCWMDLSFLRGTVKKLRHDEHFHFAVASDLVKECIISACVNATIPAHEALKVRWDERWGEENKVLAEPEKFRGLADSVLETEYLAARFGQELPEHCILDIDCDYFSTLKSLRPENPSYFHRMVSSASLITISLEREWVNLLRFPGEELLTSERIAETLFPGLFDNEKG
ncbi:MAG: hypothetical protein J6331_05810 [Lentisphaeria bacterium]|nr:hypothetical protein [Lentisphaeria bacterium]